MKNITIVLLTILFIQPLVYSQPCLPEGITFSTQMQIDSFQFNYPNCTEIEGNTQINGDDITNLLGLNVLFSVGGNLLISHNDNLASLNGLENLESVSGDLTIQYNQYLINISALNNLTFIGGNAELKSLYALTSLSGLENLTSIPGSLIIGGHPNGSTQYQDGTALCGLEGLNNLVSIGEDLIIIDNDNLTTLIGLENVNAIGGNILINHNDELIDLTGLENITSLEGDLTIGGYGFGVGGGNLNLISLEGLNSLTSVSSLNILGNYSLTSLTALENLTTVEGSLWIGIDFFNIGGNSSLTNLNGLVNVNFIGDHLWIQGNSSLSFCEVESICNYLANPNGEIHISANASGCNSPEEVEQACEATTVEDLIVTEPVSIKPNPFSSSITIEYELAQTGKISIKIYNQIGQQVDELINELGQIGKNNFFWNSHHLPSGIYYLSLKTDNKVLTERIVKL